MYVRAQEGLGQVPTLHSSFAGALGANPLPPRIREFFNRVRERPQDFKKLLLTVTFHPDPLNSKLISRIEPIFVDEMLMHNLQPVDLLKPLRRIRDAFQKRDAQFKQQIEANLQLRNEMVKMAGGLGPQKLRPFLIETLFPAGEYAELYDWKLCRLGRNFAQIRLPRELAQRIINSEASEALLTTLGRFLRRYGEVLQTKDPFFKALVAEERKHRELKREQERKQPMEQKPRKRQQGQARP